MNNKKLKLQNLAIELTKRCNLDCAHCLKGKSQKVDISKETIDNIFSQIDSIGRLFLTGGEPTLASDALENIIESIKKYNVSIAEWGMDTNGTMYSTRFYNALVELEKICRESTKSNDMHGTICISTDDYHKESIKKAGLLARARYKKSIKETERLPWFIGYRDVPNELFNEGRAVNIHDKKKIRFKTMHYSLMEMDDSYLIGVMIFVNANGDITQCDCSHERQQSNFYVGNVSNDLILNIVRNSKNVAFFNDLGEFYDDMEKQCKDYQDPFYFEEVEER